MEHEIELVGDGLRLRPFRFGAAGAAFLRALAADPIGQQWSRSLRQIAKDGAEGWLHSRLARADTYEWLVEDAADGRAVGRVGLHRHAPHTDLEVGYWTLREHRGRGVARRATRLVAAYAHDHLGELRIGLLHATANPASCRAALAASFRLEGRSRALLDHGDGVLWDAHRHARLIEDAWDPVPLMVPGSPRRVEGDGLVLRPWEPADAAAVLRASRDPESRRWALSDVCDASSAAQWVAERAVWDEHVSWAVTDDTGTALLGSVALRELDAAAAAAQVGYWVAPEARGCWVAARAVTAAAAFARSELAVERLTLFHAVENPASCRVAQRAGFALEGVLRRAYRYSDGLLHDEHLHALVLPATDREASEARESGAGSVGTT